MITILSIGIIPNSREGISADTRNSNSKNDNFYLWSFATDKVEVNDYPHTIVTRYKSIFRTSLCTASYYATSRSTKKHKSADISRTPSSEAFSKERGEKKGVEKEKN